MKSDTIIFNDDKKGKPMFMASTGFDNNNKN